MIDSVLFDLDGTLRDWPAGIAQALAELRPELPEVVPEDSVPEDMEARLERAIDEQLLVRREGRVVDRRHYWIDVDPLPTFRQALPELDERALDPLMRRFRELLDAVPFADVHPALEQLRHGYALGVLTNGPRPQSVLQRMGFAHYFDAIVTVFGGTKKPAAAAFEAGLEELGAEPAFTAYVGDSLLNDVQGALSAGLVPVWLDRFREAYALPDGAHRIETLTDLPELLANLAD